MKILALSRKSVSRWLILAAPGDAGTRRARLEGTRLEFDVPQQRDADAIAFDDQGRVSSGGVAAAAEVGQARAFEQTQLFGERVLAEVAGVVVRDTDGVEVSCERRESSRVRAKGVRLDLGGTALRNDTFEVRDTQPIRA